MRGLHEKVHRVLHVNAPAIGAGAFVGAGVGAGVGLGAASESSEKFNS